MKNFLNKNWKIILIWVILGLILLVNTIHEKYPDEFDNILGGYLISKGFLIYKDFFSHHHPLPYWVSGLISLFTKQSFIKFRLGLAVFWWVAGLGFWKYFKKRFGWKVSKMYLTWLFIYGIASTYYWTQMMLADSLAAFLYAPIAIAMMLFLGENKKITRKDVWLVGGLSFLVWLSSQSFTYLVALTNLIIWGKYLWQGKTKLFSKENLLVGGGLALPYLLFGGYLLATGSIQEYYQQAIELNARYYVYNYPKPLGSMKINPIRYVLIVADKVLNEYWVLFRDAFKFNFDYPLNITWALTVMVGITWGLVKKKWSWVAYVVGVAILANMRSNPLSSKETDYQSAVYIFSVIGIGIYLKDKLGKIINQKESKINRLIFGGLGIILVMWWTAAGFRLWSKFEEKAFGKYMGTKPLIYDRPAVAPLINQLTTEKDRILLWPLKFEDWLYIKAKPATKYLFMVPEFQHIPRIQNEFLAELENSQAKLIYLDQTEFIRGSNVGMSGQYLLVYLEEHYEEKENNIWLRK
jgi:hypothetical protein